MRDSRATVPPPSDVERARQPEVTDEQRATFLEALSNGWSVTHAAKLIGRHRAVLYELRAADEAFAELWAEALEVGADRLEDELRRRAVEGWDELTYDGEGKLIRRLRRMNSNDLLAALKARRPELYRDSAQVQVNATASAGVQGSYAANLGDATATSLVTLLRFARERGMTGAVMNALLDRAQRVGALTPELVEEISKAQAAADAGPVVAVAAPVPPLLELPPGDEPS